MESGTVRRRHVGGASVQRDAPREDSDDEKKGLISSKDDEVEAEADRATAASTQSVALQRTDFRSFMTDLRKIDMEDVYRYWSILRDWLADVPTLARRFTPELPSALSSLSFGTGNRSQITAEQANALSDFIAENVSRPYSHEANFDELLQLWRLSFPNCETIPEQKDTHWKRLGFQGNDPATDFRSAGVLSVHALVHFAEMYPAKYQDVMLRTHGKSAEESYPFACAAINIVFLLVDVMKLRRADETPSNDSDAAIMRAALARMLERDKKAFLDLFCVCMIALDNEWVRSNGTYMTFPNIIRSTKERICSVLKNPQVRSAVGAAQLLQVNLFEE